MFNKIRYLAEETFDLELEYDDVLVTIIRSKRRRKTISTEVDLHKGVIIRAPMRTSTAKLRAVAQNNTRWIEKKLTKMREKQLLIQKSGIMYMGKQKKLDIPPKDLQKWFKTKAQEHLEVRTEHFAEIMDVTPGTIRIGNQKTLWGSCSHNNNIRYNWRVMMLPEEVIDYLVVHELAHILHKNHSTKFWGVVESILPDYKAHRKVLRKHHITELPHYV